CDPGFDVSGDCCTASCTFEVAGTGCTGDGDFCTTEACDAAGVCQHAAIICGDADACTVDGCSPATGCTFDPLPGFAGADRPPDALIADVTNAPDVDAIWRTRLLRPLPHVRGNVDRAADLVAGGHALQALRRLHYASSRLYAFQRRVTLLAARGAL